MRHLYTEEEIEGIAERRIDRLDEKLMTDRITQAEYDQAMKQLCEELDEMYRNAKFGA